MGPGLSFDLPGKRQMAIPRTHHIKTIYATRFMFKLDTDAIKKIQWICDGKSASNTFARMLNASGEGKYGL